MPPINIVTVGKILDSKAARTYDEHSALYSTRSKMQEIYLQTSYETE